MAESRAPSSETSWPIEPQVVEGTRNTPLAHVEVWAWKGSVWLLSRLPRPLLDAFKASFAPLAKWIDRRHANSAREFLRQAFGSRGIELSKADVERRVTAAYAHLLEVALTPARFERRFGKRPGALLERTEVVLSDHVRGVLERGGSVAVSSHCGDWEMAARIISEVGFRPFYVVSKPPRNQPLSRVHQRLREAGGIRLVPRRGAMAFAPKIVAAGGSLGLLLDQRARKRPVLAPFFGRLARSDRSAGVLLRRLKCPVVFVVAYRTGDLRWRFVAERVLFPEDVVGASPEEIVNLVNAELERQIMAAPEQYFWLHDRYRDTPRTSEPSEDSNPQEHP